jgi:hypothetical protein
MMINFPPDTSTGDGLKGYTFIQSSRSYQQKGRATPAFNDQEAISRREGQSIMKKG